VAIGIALLLYRPWQSDPLPLRDFAGTIALLTPTSTVGDAYDALMRSYTGEGRFQPAFMVGFAAQWSAFRANSVGWQIVRFVLMSSVLVLAVVLAVRCGATWAAGAAAMAVWLIVSSSHEAWILLQIAEPFAALFVVLAAILATSWRASSRPVLVATAMAASLLVAVLSKETMIVAVPFVVALALCRDADRWAPPEISRRSVVLVAIVAVSIGAFALAPILTTRADAATGSYAGRFDAGSVGFDRLSNAARAVLLPVTRVPWFPANALFGVVLLGGWALLARENRQRAAIAAAVLLSFPVAGILLYAAWPGFPGYYAMPFAVSVGTMLALALTAVARRGRLSGSAAYGAVAIVGVYGLVLAWNGVQADRAIRRTDWAAVQMVRGLPPGSRLIVGVPDPAHSGGVGHSLALYAATAGGTGTSPMPSEDVECNEVRAPADAPPAAVVVFSNLCGSGVTREHPPAAHAAERYVEIDWKTFRPRAVENSVSLWMAHAQ
jgi:hypothetical protein